MTHHRIADFVLRIPAYCLLGVVLPTLLWAQEPRSDEDKLWASGSQQILSGQFIEGRDALAKILEGSPNNESYREIASWLDLRDARNSSRMELLDEQRARHIKKAQSTAQEENWEESLTWIRLAIGASPTDATFLGDAWVKQVREQVQALAEQHRKDEKWAEANGLFNDLKFVFEDDPYYEQAAKNCFASLRLEAIYRPDYDWNAKLRGITQSMVSDALWEIHAKYVKDADFREVTEAALERLLLLAQTVKIQEVHVALKDDLKRAQFVGRLNGRLKRVRSSDSFTYDMATDMFKNVLRINRQTVDLPQELVIFEYLEGALNYMDQFTSMIWPSDLQEFEKHTQGHFTGVGIQIGLEENELTVISPLEDTPAFRAGLQAGDKITKVDGESTEGWTLNKAVQRIMGPRNTSVALAVHRPSSNEDIEVSIVRDVIQIRTIKGFSRQDGAEWNFFADEHYKIAYIRMTNFAENSTADLKKALKTVTDKNARALILDLRFNPGGLLRSAIEVSELFLPAGKLVVRTNGLHTEEFSRDSNPRGKPLDLPIVVLINEQSASASEIVAGALRDHGRATIVGERSFGKGSVQNLIPLRNTGGHLKLTTAHYYLPNGECIHKMPEADAWGVEPDIVVDLVNRETLRVLNMRRDSDIIRSAMHEEGSSAVAAPATDQEPKDQDQAQGDDAEQDNAVDEDQFVELPDVDYQLETALLVLRVQLLKEVGFELLPKVKLGDSRQRGVPAVVTN